MMDGFVDKGYFSIGDVAKNIMTRKTRQDQIERLIWLLHQKQSEAGIFDFFLTQLAEHGYKDLARTIRETEIRPEQVSGNGAGDDRYPEIPEKLKLKRVTENDAMLLSKTFPVQNLDVFGACLGLDEVEISHVKADNMKYTASTVIQELICKWIRNRGCSATLETLHNLFQKHSNDINLNSIRYDEALKNIIKQ